MCILLLRAHRLPQGGRSTLVRLPVLPYTTHATHPRPGFPSQQPQCVMLLKIPDPGPLTSANPSFTPPPASLSQKALRLFRNTWHHKTNFREKKRVYQRYNQRYYINQLWYNPDKCDHLCLTKCWVWSANVLRNQTYSIHTYIQYIHLGYIHTVHTYTCGLHIHIYSHLYS